MGNQSSNGAREAGDRKGGGDDEEYDDFSEEEGRNDEVVRPKEISQRMQAVARMEKLLEKFNTAVDANSRAYVCEEIYELLLQPDMAILLETPNFREVAIDKAYQFADHPIVAQKCQQFLMKYHPEALGIEAEQRSDPSNEKEDKDSTK